MVKRTAERANLDPPPEPSKALRRFADDGSFADLDLVLADGVVPVAAILLAAVSPVFERMLCTPMREKEDRRVDLKELPPLGVRALVTFAYARDDPLSVEAVVPAWAVADQYICPSLAERCSREVSGATAESALLFLAEADRLGHTASHEAARSRLEELLADVDKWQPSEVEKFSTGFKQLPVAAAREVISVLPAQAALSVAEAYGLASFGADIPIDCSRLTLPDLARVVRAGVLSFDTIGDLLSTMKPPNVYRCLEPARVAPSAPLLVPGQRDEGCLDRGALVAVLEQRIVYRLDASESVRFRYKLLSPPLSVNIQRPTPLKGWVSEVATDGTRLLEQVQVTDVAGFDPATDD
jgi:hypothetical protein